MTRGARLNLSAGMLSDDTRRNASVSEPLSMPPFEEPDI